jgi:sulfite exporter TauE/SafE
LRGLLAYHGARMASYVGVGSLAGSLGSLGNTESFAQSGGFAFFLGGIMLLFATGLGDRIGPLPGLGRALPQIMQKTRMLPLGLRAGMLGACTPFLPCGLLYAAIAAAAVTGSAGNGALSMLAFAIGSGPLLLLAQVQLGWLRRHLGPRGMLRLARGTMLVAGCVLLWRGWVEFSAANCH